MSAARPGRDGGPWHAAMMDEIPKVIVDLNATLADCMTIIPDYHRTLMRPWLCSGNANDAPTPDALVIYRPSALRWFVEFGDYNPSKWPEESVIHVGKDGAITAIRCDANDLVRVLTAWISRAFAAAHARVVARIS